GRRCGRGGGGGGEWGGGGGGEGDRPRRAVDRGGRERRRPGGRDGVHVGDAVPPDQGAVRIPDGARRARGRDVSRRVPLSALRAVDGRDGGEPGSGVRDPARRTGCLRGRVAAASRGGGGRGTVRRRDRAGRDRGEERERHRREGRASAGGDDGGVAVEAAARVRSGDGDGACGEFLGDHGRGGGARSRDRGD